MVGEIRRGRVPNLFLLQYVFPFSPVDLVLLPPSLSSVVPLAHTRDALGGLGAISI